MAEPAHPTLDLRRRAETLQQEAAKRDSCARAMHLIAADFRRWGLQEQEEEARRGARSMRISALLDRANAASLLASATAPDRLSK